MEGGGLLPISLNYYKNCHYFEKNILRTYFSLLHYTIRLYVMV